MKIGGFVKNSLSDYPGKVAAVVFTQGCNLRCPYCHNPELLAENVPGTVLWEDVWNYLQSRHRHLDGVVISGGEPLLQPDIEDVMLAIRSLGLSIKLDTNGTFPDKLEMLIQDNLIDYVAMDIKASASLFQKTVRKDIPYHYIEKSIELLKQAKIPYEFRSTLVDGLHDLTEVEAMARHIAGAPLYYLQRVSGFQTLDPDILSKASYSDQAMQQFKSVAQNHVGQCQLR